MSSDSDAPFRILQWPLPLAAVWVALPVAGACLFISSVPIAPHDYWWHLAMGRMIDATGAIPRSNLFLYTVPAEKSFVDQPWLAQWLLYRLYRAGEHLGPYLARNGLGVVTWTALGLLAVDRSPDPRVAGGVLLAVASVSGVVFGVRTQMFALPLYVAAVGILLNVADGRWSDRWLAGLIPVTALWSNLHGSFALVPVLSGAVGLARCVESAFEGNVERRTAVVWGGTTAGTLVAGAVNPHGVGIYRYVVELTVFSDVRATVSEWQPPDPVAFFGAVALGLMAVGLAIAVWRRATVRIHEAVVLAAGTVLGAGSVRSIFFWAAAAALVLPRQLAGGLGLPRDGRAPETSAPQGVAHVAAVGLLAASVIAAQPGMPGFGVRDAALGGTAKRGGLQQRLLSVQNATGLVDRLAEKGAPGRIFHGQGIGGLLDFVLGARDPQSPRPVAFVDQRMTLVPRDVWAAYFDISRARPGWQRRLERWDVRTLLVNNAEQRSLVQAAQASEAWRLEAVGSGHLLFIRSASTRRPSPRDPDG